ncbi:MAG TPA: ABC transporter permease [bacterium]|nr:ABC transporter permease [bacterium]
MSFIYIGRRLASGVIVLFATVLVAFVLIHLSGDPVQLMLPFEATQQQVDTLRAELGLNLPLPVQFERFLVRAARGDFGESIRQQQPALGLVLERVPASLALLGASAVVMLVLGIPLGAVAAARQRSLVDTIASAAAVLGQSVPTFWVGMLLILVFAVRLRWFPYGGGGGLDHLVMPGVTLGIFSSAIVARLTRSGLVEALATDYVRTARAKGLSERLVLYRHALRNAALPILTVIGIQIPTLLAGAIVTEQVFSYPGMARLAVQAIGYRDVPVVQAFVVVFTTVVVVTNLVVDVLYFALNPRIRYQ